MLRFILCFATQLLSETINNVTGTVFDFNPNQQKYNSGRKKTAVIHRSKSNNTFIGICLASKHKHMHFQNTNG